MSSPINIVFECSEQIRVTSAYIEGNNIENTERADGTWVIAPMRTSLPDYTEEDEEDSARIAYGPWSAGDGRDADYGARRECVIPLTAKIANVEVNDVEMLSFVPDAFAPGDHELVVTGNSVVSLGNASLDQLTCRAHNKSVVCKASVRRGDFYTYQSASISNMYVHEAATLSPNGGGFISANYPASAKDKIEIRDRWLNK